MQSYHDCKAAFLFYNRTRVHKPIGFDQTGSHFLSRKAAQSVVGLPSGYQVGAVLIPRCVMKNNRKLRRKKSSAWYRADIKRIDALIDKIRAARFGGRND